MIVDSSMCRLLALAFAIMHLSKCFYIVSLHSFAPFNLESINQTERSTIPTCLSLILFYAFFLNKGKIPGTNSLKMLFDICI